MLLKRIVESIKKETSVDILDIKLKGCRKRHIVDAKRVYAMIARSTTLYSLEVVGNFIYRDHCTIVHYIKTGRNLIGNDNDFENLYYRCLKNVNDTPYIDVVRSAYHYHLKKADEYLHELNQLLVKPDEVIIKKRDKMNTHLIEL